MNSHYNSGLNHINYNEILGANISSNSNISTYTNVISNLYCGTRDDLYENPVGINLIIDASFQDYNIKKNNPLMENRDVYKISKINYREIISIVNIIESNLLKNKKIFIFCRNGFEMSGFIIACYFIKYTKHNKMNVISCLKSINPLFFSVPLDTTYDIILDTLIN